MSGDIGNKSERSNLLIILCYFGGGSVTEPHPEGIWGPLTTIHLTCIEKILITLEIPRVLGALCYKLGTKIIYIFIIPHMSFID